MLTPQRVASSCAPPISASAGSRSLPGGSPSDISASPGAAPIAARSESAARQRAVADLLAAQLRAAEVDAVDHRVERGDGVAACPDHGRVIADPPHHARVVRRQHLLERRDQFEFTHPSTGARVRRRPEAQPTGVGRRS